MPSLAHLCAGTVEQLGVGQVRDPRPEVLHSSKKLAEPFFVHPAKLVAGQPLPRGEPATL